MIAWVTCWFHFMLKVWLHDHILQSFSLMYLYIQTCCKIVQCQEIDFSCFSFFLPLLFISSLMFLPLQISLGSLIYYYSTSSSNISEELSPATYLDIWKISFTSPSTVEKNLKLLSYSIMHSQQVLTDSAISSIGPIILQQSYKSIIQQSRYHQGQDKTCQR